MQYRYATRHNKSVSVTLPAPIKGLNVRDSLADMQPDYAIVMDNYLPLDTKITLRKGYVRYGELNGKISSLAVYNYGTSKRMLAVANHKIWNVTSRNNVYAYDPSLTDDFCQTVQYKNYLYFVNGFDVPKVYYIDDDGHEHLEDWGFFADDLNGGAIINAAVSQQRLWFVEKGTLKVWYAEAAGNIQGNLQCFDLSQVSRFGGELMAVASWTQDGGSGMDDLTVFITSEGEAMVYIGSDIGDAEDWRLKGSFRISRPIGYNCLVAYQGDVVVISEDGYIPLSKALPLNEANTAQIAFSDAIRGLVLERTAKYAKLRGWQGIIYGRGGYALFNVPLSGNNFEQHVINLNTGAWCRFTGINAVCWCEFDKRLYFGTSAGLCLFDEGLADDGEPIYGAVEQAYANLGTDELKKIQLLNPRTKAYAKFALVIYTNMDMEQREVDYEESIGDSTQTRWNTIKWAAAEQPTGHKWGNSGNAVMRSQWIANSSTGYKASIVFKTKTKGNMIEWYETGIRYERGNGVL